MLDEVQQLVSARSKSKSEILNFLFELEDQVGVPFVLVGMEGARDMLAEEERTSRRASGQGAYHWEPLRSREWNIFVKGIWGYQYAAVFTPLTDELSQALYRASAGVPDYAVKAYAHAQMHAIREAIGRRDHDERLASKLFDEALRRDMVGTWQLIQKLKAAGPTIQIDQRLTAPANQSGPKSAAGDQPNVPEPSPSSTGRAETTDAARNGDEDRTVVDTVPDPASDVAPSAGTSRRRTTAKSPPKNDLAATVAEGQDIGLDPHKALAQRGLMATVTDLVEEP